MSRSRRAGFTLIELMVVVVLLAILTAAVSYAFVAGLDIERRQARTTQQRIDIAGMEQRITNLLQSAFLSGDANDATTFFVATNDSGSEIGADTLTFTTTAPGVPLVALGGEDDFETRNENQGPVGGVEEVAYSMTPVGDAGNRTGLFERMQRPSDGDPTQGGMEGVLSPQVESIGFEFYNGTDWVNTWDTVSGERRLPSSVRVRYTLNDDSTDATYSFLVPIPTSDVDAQDPSLNGAAL